MTAVTGQQANAIHGTQGHSPADVHDAGEHLDRPEAWGWHGETGKLGRAGAWVTVVVLVLFTIGNEPFGAPGTIAALGFAALLVIVLLWDRHRRKNAWRAP
jgi:Protein of unknown function (DUF2631)